MGMQREESTKRSKETYNGNGTRGLNDMGTREKVKDILRAHGIGVTAIAVLSVLLLLAVAPAFAAAFGDSDWGSIFLLAEATGDEEDEETDDSTYQIDFDSNLNEASGDMDVIYCPPEISSCVVPENGYVSTHYKFTGWNTKEDGTGTAFAPGDEIQRSDMPGMASEGEDQIILYAQWEARKYVIHFSRRSTDTSATGSMDDLEMTYDVPQNLPANAFAKEGYVFAGWTIAEDGSSLIYADKSEVLNLIDSVGGDDEEADDTPDPFADPDAVPEVTLYTQWYSENYTIHYLPGADDVTGTGPADQTVAHDDLVTLPEGNYSRDGYIFVGWAPEKNCQSALYPAGGTLSALLLDDSSDAYLYAQWRLPTYTITYNKGDDLATGMPSFATDAENEQRRVGWDENDSTTWTETVAWDDSITVPSGGLSRPHATMIGWKSREDEIDVLTSADPVSHLACDDSGKVQLTAQWEMFSYTVSLDPNIPEGATRTDEPEEGSEGGYSQVFLHNDPMGIRENQYTTDYYNFAGWNTKADGTGVSYRDEEKLQFVTSQETPEAGATPVNADDLADQAGITLYAQWTPRALVVSSIDSLAGTVIDQQSVARGGNWAPVEAPSHVGYTVNPAEQWLVRTPSGEALDSSALTGMTQDVTVTITYTPIKFTIVFDKNEANTSNAVTGEMSPLEVEYNDFVGLPECAFTNEPNEFLYWSTVPVPSEENPGLVFPDASDTSKTEGEEDGTKVSNLVSTEGGTITLYAQWSKEQIHIGFIDGFSMSPIVDEEENPTEIVVEYGDSIADAIASKFPSFDALQEANCHERYIPDKWTTAEGEDIPEGAVATVNTSLILSYRPVRYTVRFNGNADSVTGTATMEDIQNVPYDTDAFLPACSFEKPGHSFAGWNTKEDGTGIIYEDEAPMRAMSDTDGAVVTLYAQWTVGSLSVTFYDGLTNTKMTTVTIPYGSSVTAPDFVSHTGYKVTGWDHSLDNITTDNLIITANYAPITYQIVFDANDDDDSPAQGSMEPQRMTYGQSRQISACLFVREGYTFSHWTTTEDGGGNSYANKQSIQNLADTDNATVTLYAQWTEARSVPYTVNHVRSNDATPFATERLLGRIGSTTKATPRSVTGYAPKPFDQKVIEGENATTVDIMYDPISYTIEFSPNSPSATGRMESVTTPYDGTVTLPKNSFALYGHVWMSWNTSPTGTGYSFEDAQSVKNLASEEGATVTLYAQWSRLYEVSYVDPLVSESVIQTQRLTDVTKATPPATPSHDGYSFTGWSKNTALNGDVTYTAVYAETAPNGRTTPETNEEEVNKSVTDRQTIVKRIIKSIVRTTVNWTKGKPGGSKVVTSAGGGTDASVAGATSSGGTVANGNGAGNGTVASRNGVRTTISTDNLTQTGDATVWICGTSIGLAASLWAFSAIRRRRNEA